MLLILFASWSSLLTPINAIHHFKKSTYRIYLTFERLVFINDVGKIRLHPFFDVRAK